MDVLQTRLYNKVHCATYIRCLLKAHGWDNAGPHALEAPRARPTPIDERSIKGLYHIYPGPAEGTDEHALLATKNGFSYRSLIGEVLYAYVGCRLDIGYGTVTLAKFNSAPQDQHYGASKGLVKYL